MLIGYTHSVQKNLRSLYDFICFSHQTRDWFHEANLTSPAWRIPICVCLSVTRAPETQALWKRTTALTPLAVSVWKIEQKILVPLWNACEVGIEKAQQT